MLINPSVVHSTLSSVFDVDQVKSILLLINNTFLDKEWVRQNYRAVVGNDSVSFGWDIVIRDFIPDMRVLEEIKRHLKQAGWKEPVFKTRQEDNLIIIQLFE